MIACLILLHFNSIGSLEITLSKHLVVAGSQDLIYGITKYLQEDEIPVLEALPLSIHKIYIMYYGNNIYTTNSYVG